MKLEDLKKRLEEIDDEPYQYHLLCQDAIRLAEAYKYAAQIVWKKHGLVMTWGEEDLDSEAERLMEKNK